METSLTGKALNFGFKEYRFESRVSNIIFKSHINLLNILNINFKKKKLFFFITYSNFFFNLIFIFKKLGLIKNFYILKKKKNYFLKIHTLFYKNFFFFYKFKFFTIKSKKYLISFKALKLIKLNTKNSILILSNNENISYCNKLIKNKKGGLLLSLITI